MIKTKEDLIDYLIKDYFDDKHKKILQLLEKETLMNSEVAKRLKISDPMATYYINGFVKSKKQGLVQLGLLKRVLDDYGKTLGFTITDLGKDVLKVLK